MICFKILTIFPEIFESFLSQSLIHKALSKKVLNIETFDFRKFGVGKHKKVDDTPYGGGPGMLLKPEPIVNSINFLESELPEKRCYRVLMSPQGKRFDQKKAIELSQLNQPIMLICGRFEGFDERIRGYVDDEISLGDFVMLGGEVAAMAVVEAVSRLAPGVIGNAESFADESFYEGLLEHSQYTKPFEFEGKKVPDVLVSGNHQKIADWRLSNALKKTKTKRHDLYQEYIKNSKPSA